MSDENCDKRGSQEIIFDITTVAQQAHGVIAKCGGTSILCTTVVGERVVSDFIPLSVHYIEKFTSVNKMPGGYRKREGAVSDGEILITRAIDRSLRAIIPDEFANEIQVIIQVLSYDGCAPEILAIAAGSLSLNLAHVTNKLIAAAKVTSDEQGFVINKAVQKMAHLAGNGHCDLLQAVCDENPERKRADVNIVMLEFMGNIVPKAHLKDFLKTSLSTSAANVKKMQQLGMDVAKEIITSQKKTLKSIGHVHKKLYAVTVKPTIRKQLIETMNDFARDYFETIKHVPQLERRKMMNNLRLKFLAQCDEVDTKIYAQYMFDEIISQQFADILFAKKRRLDGRKFDEIREINMQIGFIPSLHGSALFSRGNTQALVSVTVAPYADAQSIETLHGIHRENFLLHYNFLPYCVYEIGKIGAVSRREIGHGELARRSFLSQLPRKLDCAVRILSEITSSNGSSSMATVCGTSLALFDAGVPLAAHVGGISIGLIEKTVKNKTKYQLLADITGLEDTFGKMDFKIAATKTEITSMQLDIKNGGIPQEVLSDAIDLGLKHIKKILVKMYKVLKEPKETMHGVQEVIKIDPSKVRLVIGKGGATVNSLTQEFNVKIDVDRSGKIIIAPNGAETTKANIQEVVEKIRKIVQ